MRIEGKKGGKVTGHTVRRTNHKNIEVLGKSGVEKLEMKGKRGILKKNFHSSIGGKKSQFMHTELYLTTHDDIDEQLHEAEEELNYKAPQKHKLTK